MNIRTYKVGELVRVTARFTRATNAAVDPAVVKLTVLKPDATTTTNEFNADGDTAIVKDSLGHYHADVDADLAGVWKFRWFSTGDGQAANEGSFVVAPTDFP